MEYGPSKPTKKFLSEFLVLAGLHVLLFMVVYKFTNSTAHSLDPDQLLHYYHPLELEIPFIPEWFVVYYSINLMLWMPLFFLTVHRFRRYIVAQVLATFIAAFFFYFFPFDCGYVRSIPPDEPWKTILTFFYSVDEPHNLVPSLHIGYSTTVLLFVREFAKDRWYIVFHLWTLAIFASVILTHQHHLIDIVTGVLLSLVVYRLANILPNSWGTFFALPAPKDSLEDAP